MSKTVLVIDDDSVVNDLACDALRAAGHEVSSALGGEQGLKIAKEIRPEVFVVDINMPGMNGFEVCEAIRDDIDLAYAKIIVFTAKVFPADKRGAAKVGADAYLTKPVVIEDLVAEVESDRPGRGAPSSL